LKFYEVIQINFCHSRIHSDFIYLFIYLFIYWFIQLSETLSVRVSWNKIKSKLCISISLLLIVLQCMSVDHGGMLNTIPIEYDQYQWFDEVLYHRWSLGSIWRLKVILSEVDMSSLKIHIGMKNLLQTIFLISNQQSSCFKYEILILLRVVLNTNEYSTTGHIT
jgi:hypothetical protein